MLEAHTPGSQRIRKAQKEPGPSNSILLGGPSSGYTESFDVQHPEVKLDFPDDVCVYHGLHHTRLTQYLIPYTSPHFGFDDLSLTLISTNVTGESHVPSHSNQLDRGEALRCDLLFIGYVERFRWPTSDHTRRMVTIHAGGTEGQRYLSCFAVVLSELHLEICDQQAYGIFEDNKLYQDGGPNIPTEELKVSAKHTLFSCEFKGDRHMHSNSLSRRYRYGL